MNLVEKLAVCPLVPAEAAGNDDGASLNLRWDRWQDLLGIDCDWLDHGGERIVGVRSDRDPKPAAGDVGRGGLDLVSQLRGRH